MLRNNILIMKRIKTGGRKLKTFEEYSRLVNIKHNNKYEYIEYVKVKNKNCVKYICSIHGEKTQDINDHKRGAGCKDCGIIKRKKKRNIIKWKEKLIKQSKIDNGIIITVLNFYVNRDTNIDFYCNCGKKYNKNIRVIVEKSGMFCNNCTIYNKTEKSKKTCLEKYGVEYNTQNKEILSKVKRSSYGTKEYIFKTGETVEIQGYENIALKILKEQGYNYEDIKIEGIEIKFEFENINRNHFPDIYIPKENRIIEVKSTYTYDIELSKNIQKQISSKNQGYIYEFWIFDDKHKLRIIH